LEKTLSDLRSQQLVAENNRQKLQEEIDSLKYRLAEAEAGKGRVEKSEAKLTDENQELIAEKVNEYNDLQELRKHIKQLSQPLQELRKELELESKILIVVK